MCIYIACIIVCIHLIPNSLHDWQIFQRKTQSVASFFVGQSAAEAFLDGFNFIFSASPERTGVVETRSMLAVYIYYAIIVAVALGESFTAETTGYRHT